MCNSVIKTIIHPDGMRRVLIVKRSTGTYGFMEEHYSPEEDEEAWLPIGPRSSPMCESEASAESEARGRIGWLSEVPYRIYFDPNDGSMEDGYPLNCIGSRRDIEPISDRLEEGMRVTIYSGAELEMEAVLEFDHSHGFWIGRPITDALR